MGLRGPLLALLTVPSPSRKPYAVGNSTRGFGSNPTPLPGKNGSRTARFFQQLQPSPPLLFEWRGRLGAITPIRSIVAADARMMAFFRMDFYLSEV